MKTLGGIFLIPCLAFTSFCKGQNISDPSRINSASPGETVPYSLIISEIMADPHPAVSLPDAEYLEIYNRGPSPVNLEGYRLLFGDKLRILHPPRRDGYADGVVSAGEYIILCDEDNSPAFDSLRKTLPIHDMPAIINAGATLVLESPSGNVIHSVSFTDGWYRNADKAEGGCSLEMIDPENPCGRAGNWRESKDITGGTPGYVNSVNGINTDIQKPELLRASIDPDSSVILYFSEDMDSNTLKDPLNYYATQGLLHPAKADPVEPAFSTVSLTFNGNLNIALTYTVTVLNTLNDCVGNPLQNNAQADFAIARAADSFDVVINELLFDASPGTSEFIELYNRSDKVIDLSGFSIISCNVNTDSITRSCSLKEISFLLFPEQYVVLTRRADLLPDKDGHPDLSSVIELPSLFTFPDKEGKIAIINNENKVLDMFFYFPSMHSIFLKEKEGISLERINADLPTNDAGNWYSAAFDRGYSTPGYKNSQENSNSGQDEPINIYPAVFSPDGDGSDDQVFLTVSPGAPGYVGNILIFDQRGRKIKTLCENRLLGTETIISWDGKCNDSSNAPIGIYLISTEIFNRQGEVKKYLKVVTVARRLIMIN